MTLLENNSSQKFVGFSFINCKMVRSYTGFQIWHCEHACKSKMT